MSRGQSTKFNIYNTRKVFRLTRGTFERKAGQDERKFQNNCMNNNYGVKLKEITKKRLERGKQLIRTKNQTKTTTTTT